MKMPLQILRRWACNRLTSLWHAGAVVFIGVLLSTGPAPAQMLGPFMSQLAGPFAGRIAPNGSEMAPLYGSQAGALPHLLQGPGALAQAGGALSNAQISGLSAGTPSTPNTGSEMAGHPKSGGKVDAPDADLGEPIWEMLIGSCAGGAFIGAFSAVTAAVPVGVVLSAAPVVATAMVAGCGIGIATAAVSFGAVFGWQKAIR
jgi:hypothetical protein